MRAVRERHYYFRKTAIERIRLASADRAVSLGLASSAALREQAVRLGKAISAVPRASVVKPQHEASIIFDVPHIDISVRVT